MNYKVCFGTWPKVLSFLSGLVPLGNRKIGSVLRSNQCTSLLSGFVGSSLLMIQEAQRRLEVRQNLFRKKVLTYRYQVWKCMGRANFAGDSGGW